MHGWVVNAHCFDYLALYIDKCRFMEEKEKKRGDRKKGRGERVLRGKEGVREKKRWKKI